MASQLDFIRAIAPIVQKYASKYEIKVVSPIIAQACLESAYGTSVKAKYHNYFGLKYRANRVTVNNGYFLDGGSEQNKDGTYTPLPSSTAWYAFDDMEKGVEGYFQFINIPNYSNLKTTSDPYTYLKYIKEDHYATSLKYVDNVYAVITKYNLTQYDIIDKQEEKVKMNLNIVQNNGITNTTLSPNRAIEWIVLHYTAGTNSKAGAAAGTANWFKKTAAQGSADFIVDDNTIVQYNGDIKNRYCWSVGGSKYNKMTTSLGGQYYKQCRNANSISIEMCSNKINTKTLNATDTDWYFTTETINNAITLTRYLMELYNIDINHVIMHHQVTGKVCPNPWTVSEDRLSNWRNFLAAVQNNTSTIVVPTQLQKKDTSDTNFTPFIVEVKIDNLNYRSGPSLTETVKGVTGKGKFTIVEVNGEFGKLKSGIGWIYLGNPNYVSIPTNAIKQQQSVQKEEENSSYIVQVTTDFLRIRQGPGTNYKITGVILGRGKYTIVEEKSGWGKLKSGMGWISLSYTKKV